MYDEPNCFKAYISKSGLFKHKRTHIPQDSDESVICMDCNEAFKHEDDCNNHECPTRPPKPKQKKRPKTEPQESFESECESTSAGKRSTRSTQIKKEIKLRYFHLFNLELYLYLVDFKAVYLL